MDAEATRPVILTVEAGDLCADLATVDWLARLALLARRGGGRVVLRGASTELCELIELAGLAEMFPALRLRAVASQHRNSQRH